MIKLTTKTHEIRTTTVDQYGFKMYMNAYSNGDATIYYHNNAGWQQMSAAIANRYSHVLQYCDWIIIDATEPMIQAA